MRRYATSSYVAELDQADPASRPSPTSAASATAGRHHLGGGGSIGTGSPLIGRLRPVRHDDHAPLALAPADLAGLAGHPERVADARGGRRGVAAEEAVE